MRQLAVSAMALVLVVGSAYAVDCPVLEYPDDGAGNVPRNISDSVTVKWQAVAGATGYDVYFGPAGSGCSNLHATETGTTWAPPSSEIFDGATYEWKVTAIGVAGCTSPCRTFTMVTCPTTAPTLEFPAEESTVPFGQIDLNWSDVPNATHYEVFIAVDGGSPSLIGVTTVSHKQIVVDPGRDITWAVKAKAPGCDGMISYGMFSTTCPEDVPIPNTPADGSRFNPNSQIFFSWTSVPGSAGYDLQVSADDGATWEAVVENLGVRSYTTTLPAGEWQWRVRANFDGNCEPAYSEKSTLVVTEETCNNPPPALIAPADHATVTVPFTLDWDDVPNAVLYHVLMKPKGGTAQRIASTVRSTVDVDTLDKGEYEWAIVADFEGCPNTTSAGRTIIVAGQACPDDPPQLVSPANGATGVDTPPTFDWNGVDGATEYRLFVALGDEEFKFSGETTGTELSRFVPENAVIRWFVSAVFPGECAPVRSPVFTFRTAAGASCPDQTINLTAPANGATVSSPVALSWSAIDHVVAYRVYVSIDGEAPVILTRTTTNSATVRLPAGNVVWRVEAQRGNDCPPVFSGEGRFTVQTGGNCAGNQAPVLVAPIGTREAPASVRNPVSFSWAAVANAIGYRIWVAQGSPAAFEDIGLTRETHLEKLLPPGSYQWFAQALFENCRPVDSTTSFFIVQADEPRCSDEVPTILEPANGATVTTLRFRVVEIPSAVRYRFFAARAENADDPGDFIFLGSSPEPVLEVDLPPGSYVAFAEAEFEECKSTFSPRVSFTIPRGQDCDDNPAPTLVAPANGASVTTQSVDLSWNAAAGASFYVVFAQAGDGAPTPIAKTTDTLITHNFPRGEIHWRVAAFFENCEPEVSEEFVFVVAPPAQCATRKPVLLSPPSRAEVPSPVFFAATAVPNAKAYHFFAWQGDEEPVLVASSDEPRARVELPPGHYQWMLEAGIEGCDPVHSAVGEFTVIEDTACGTPGKPRAQVVGQALSGTPYRLRWTEQANTAQYEVQESRNPEFESAETFIAEEPEMVFEREQEAEVRYYYRVRAVSDCNDQVGPYSNVVSVLIVPLQTKNASAEIGTREDVVQKVFLPGAAGGVAATFSVAADKPWLKVSPSSGTLPPEGITLTLTGDPDQLNLGTNTATLRVTTTTATSGLQSQASTTSPIPVNVSLVTPVAPAGKSAPPPDALIFPVVGHAAGANNSFFESDIRVTNLGATTKKYQVNFTPSGTDGTVTGSTSTIEIAPNQTVALDDIVASLFGTSATSSLLGMLEVRPLTSTPAPSSGFTPVIPSGIAQLLTAASSRTYNFTPNGTFGQFIPAIPFAKFIGKAVSGPNPILALQQVAESVAYRANFGFAEGSGQPANLIMRVYDKAGTLLATIPVSLGATQHQQINGLLANNGIKDLADGRVEIEVTGGNGKVTAYVSEIDNKTNDPFLVEAKPKGGVTSSRYVLPGMAYINTGFAFWVSDVRIFNAGTTSTPATLTFYPQGNPAAPVSKDILLEAGEIEVIDNVVGGFLAQPNGAGGQIVITTPANTTLMTTARTYNQTSNGTYGQYIPGVTPAESVGANDRALQILQLETSPRIRSNIGLSETSGYPATVEVSVIQSDSIATPFVQIPLAANEFRQISLADFFEPGAAVYNARVTVKVISGIGRVTAYGSAIDVITQDPTYVVAQ